MQTQLHIVLVGYGAIAQYVLKNIQHDPSICVSGLICRDSAIEKARAIVGKECRVVTSVEQLDDKAALLVDCAGHSGLSSHAPAALRSGMDVISLSSGALAEPALAELLEQSALQGNSAIRFLSGAIGGIDALSAASVGEIENVVYTGRKPPQGWLGSPAEQQCNLQKLSQAVVHFCGSAREAAMLYPKNANVAATVALSTIGLDKVCVQLIADPDIKRNVHEIVASGAFGKLSLTLEGNPLESNPRSSALAAMSIVSELNRRTSALGF